jgi:hypothetical protein
MLSSVRQKPESESPKVGVCYVTTVGEPGHDISDLLVRLDMTFDVASSDVTTQHARGPEAACSALRSWMNAMCRPQEQRHSLG